MSSNPGGDRPDPTLRPTSVSALVVAALAAAAAAWLVLSATYQSWPALPWTPVVIVTTLAVAEFLLAQNTAARVQRKPNALPVQPLAVARYVVLAKASALAGALYAGFSAGVLAWLSWEPTKAARDDIPAAIGATLASFALVAGALWLEHACRVPRLPDRRDPDDPGLT